MPGSGDRYPYRPHGANARHQQDPAPGRPQAHTASNRYLKALSQGQTRFDLDGNPNGIVTPEQRQQATDILRERFRKGAEQRKIQQREKEQQEKLLKLAEKFNTR